MNLGSGKGQDFFLCKYRGFGNSCLSCSSYVYALWYHYKICTLLSPTCHCMCCYNGCMSAWFCEREVRVVDCRWYKLELCGIFFSLQAVSRLVFYKCTCYSFFEKHLFNHIWWSEVDLDIKFHHNNSCSKQRISNTSWTSQGIDH
jgi:hypothetical protein